MPAVAAAPRDETGLTAALIVAMRLREARQDRHITVAEVGRSMGITPSYVTRIEQGQRNLRLSDAYAMALAIGVDLRDLLP